MPIETELMTVEQVAERLGVHAQTIARWRRDRRVGFPAPVRLGPRQVRWTPELIEAWLKERASCQ